MPSALSTVEAIAVRGGDVSTIVLALVTSVDDGRGRRSMTCGGRMLQSGTIEDDARMAKVTSKQFAEAYTNLMSSVEDGAEMDEKMCDDY